MVKAAEKSLNTRISGSSIWRHGAERQLTNLAAGFFSLRDSISGKTAVKLSRTSTGALGCGSAGSLPAIIRLQGSSSFGALLLADQLRDGNRQAVFRRQPL
jgi:hypothetical protein